jgi:hypothetical protein
MLLLGCIVYSQRPHEPPPYYLANVGFESARAKPDEEDEQRSQGRAEAHSAGDQPDNVDRVERREAGAAGHVRKGGESHGRDE